MTILLANLKHLYQNRGFWAVHMIVVMGYVIGAVLPNEIMIHPIVIFPLFVYMAGRFAGALQVEVMAKPLAYCLPGHRRVPRQVLSVYGFCIAFGWAAVSFLYPAGDLSSALLGAVSTFFVSTMFYWLGVWGGFSFRATVAGLAPLGVVLGGMGGGAAPLTRLLVDGWTLFMVGGCAVNIAVWRLLREDGLARGHCGRARWMARHSEKRTDVKAADVSQIRPCVERFFLDRIRGRRGTWRYVWGSLYRGGAGLRLSWRMEWVVIGLLFVGLTCFIGYTEAGTFIMFLMPALMGVHVRLGVHSSMLISGGRRERFWSALALAATDSFYMTAAITLLASVSIVLQRVMPDVTIAGHSVVYHAMDIGFFFVPLGLIPLTMAFALVLRGHPALTMGAVIMLFGVLFQIPRIIARVPDLLVHPALTVAAIVAGCWVMLAGALWYVCMCRCLGGHGRQRDLYAGP